MNSASGFGMHFILSPEALCTLAVAIWGSFVLELPSAFRYSDFLKNLHFNTCRIQEQHVADAQFFHI